jgi:nucleotide-binding universal stress UspA family protein
MSEIVVGYDGSDYAKAALDEAVALARDLGDSVVIVFGYAPHGAGGGEVEAQREAVRELGERITAEAAARVADSGVDHTVEMLPEHGANALSDLANQLDARMIVVGTHGESALKGALLGSTAHRLIQIAERPVLVVHLEDKA